MKHLLRIPLKTNHLYRIFSFFVTLFALSILFSVNMHAQSSTPVKSFEELRQAIQAKKTPLSITEDIVLTDVITIDYPIKIEGVNQEIILSPDNNLQKHVSLLYFTDAAEINKLTFKGNDQEVSPIEFMNKEKNLNINETVFSNWKNPLLIRETKEFNITKSKFIDNGYYSKFQGGALSINVIEGLSVADCTFENNKADHGGAIAIISWPSVVPINAKVIIDECTFSGNSVPHGEAPANPAPVNHGGAFYSSITDIDITISGGSFSGNKAQSGGIFSFYNDDRTLETRHTKLTIKDKPSFKSNFASSLGGVFFISTDVDTSIESGTFTENSANNGGVFAFSFYFAKNEYQGNLNLTIKEGVRFESNSALVGQGGALYINSRKYNINIEKSEFSKNTASMGGVIGVWGPFDDIPSSSITVKNAKFSGNKASYGGAISFYGKHSSTLNITNNTIFNQNESAGSGGAVFSEIKKLTLNINESSFENNKANHNGGAISLEHTEPMDKTETSLSIENSSFRNNKANHNGGTISLFPHNYTSTNDTEHKSYYSMLTLNNVSFEGNYAGNGAHAFSETNYPNLAAIHVEKIKDIQSLSIPFDKDKDIVYNNYDVNFVSNIYTVSYDGNEHTSGSEPTDDNTYKKMDQVTVLDKNDLAKKGYIFTGWNTVADGTGTNYQPDDQFAIENTTRLFAQWEKEDPVTPPSFHYIVDLIAPPVECGCYTYDPLPGRYAVKAGDCFEVNIAYEYCCFPLYTFEVYANGELVSPRDSGEFKISYEVCDIRENKVIEVKPTKVDGSVGAEEVNALNKIWSEGGFVFIQSEKATQAQVFDISGRLIVTQDISVGLNSIPLPDGFYMVKLTDNKAVKIVVRNR